ncbi:MAG: transcription antitermination factor NusB [Candidatus Hydrogenedentes bacterium]|nr:transcription antitermination factor NusB [Candidatus Hydrogenedentota bacterium]
MGRERALQFLYSLDFTGNDPAVALPAFWAITDVRPTVRAYAEKLISGVCANREELDTSINAALDNWTPDRVGKIELAAIRIALFEMIYLSDVPASVAINEAIEVTRNYGSDEAPRFVNGVLDRLRKQLETAQE